jgi:hypothetical protein
MHEWGTPGMASRRCPCVFVDPEYIELEQMCEWAGQR